MSASDLSFWLNPEEKSNTLYLLVRIMPCETRYMVSYLSFSFRWNRDTALALARRTHHDTRIEPFNLTLDPRIHTAKRRLQGRPAATLHELCQEAAAAFAAKLLAREQA